MENHRKVHYYCSLLMTSKILNASDINFLKQKIKKINEKEKRLCNVKNAEQNLTIK